MIRWLVRSGSLSNRLAIFTALVCLAIGAMFVFNTLHARSVAIDVARGEATNLAASLAQQASDTLEAVDVSLLILAERVERGQAAPRERAALRDSLAAIVTKMPRLRGLLVFDERGQFVVSNISAGGGWPGASNRPYFHYHRTHPGTEVYISGPAKSSIDDAEVIFVTRRLEHVDGSFAGVVVAPIAVEYFVQLYSAVDVGRSGSISLLADDTTLMARFPRKDIGRKIPRAALFSTAYQFESAGSYVRSSPVDDIRRLYAFRRLGRFPLVVDVALAEADYLANWYTDTVNNSVAVICVLAMIGGLATGLGAQIGRRQRAEDGLARLASIDGLTGIANRRQFDTVLERDWFACARDRTPLALLMIDVDNFKAFNDGYGHQLGDDVLVGIARTIATGVVRPGDLVARYGGEEFAVILPAADAPSAVRVAERIRRSIGTLCVPRDIAPTIISVSVGVASIVPTPLNTSAMLIQAADAALYDAKRTGRNRTSVTLGAAGPIAPASTVLTGPSDSGLDA